MSKPEPTARPADISRRDALKTGAAVIASPALLKVHAASDPVKFGVIGVGSRGSYLVDHLAPLDTGRCVALCDVNQQALDNAAKKLTTNPKKYKDYRELLADKDVEAVVIAVPLYLHFDVTRDTLLAGKHVFLRKEPSVQSRRSAFAAHAGRRTPEAGFAGGLAAALQRLFPVL